MLHEDMGSNVSLNFLQVGQKYAQTTSAIWSSLPSKRQDALNINVQKGSRGQEVALIGNPENMHVAHTSLCLYPVLSYIIQALYVFCHVLTARHYIIAAVLAETAFILSRSPICPIISPRR